MSQEQKTNGKEIISENLYLSGNMPDWEAIVLIDEYRMALANHPKKTKSVWLDIGTLKNLIAGIDAIGGDGVRIHMARYLAKGYERVRNVKGEIRDYNSRKMVVLVPTYLKNGESVDNIDPSLVEEVQANRERYIRMIEERKNFDAYNHSKLCPPDCEGSSFTTTPSAEAED